MREWICTIKLNLYTAFYGRMLVGDLCLEQWVKQPLLPVSGLYSSALVCKSYGGEKDSMVRRVQPLEGSWPFGTGISVLSHGGISCVFPPCPASYRVSNTRLTLPLRLHGIKSIAQLKFIFKVKTMSYVLVYLICVMISPLQIWILIKKNVLGKQALSVRWHVPGQKWVHANKFAMHNPPWERAKESCEQPRVMVAFSPVCELCGLVFT